MKHTELMIATRQFKHEIVNIPGVHFNAFGFRNIETSNPISCKTFSTYIKHQINPFDVNLELLI